MVRRITLPPVREDEAENHRARWKRRAQILGSVLYWAHHAKACRIEFDSSQTEPFSYFTSAGGRVTTELGQTPPEYVDSIAPFIRDTIDGHPLVRPFRRLFRKLAGLPIEALIEIQPTDVYFGSAWYCTMNGETALFVLQSEAKPIQNAGQPIRI